jgi:hypothetical protein
MQQRKDDMVPRLRKYADQAERKHGVAETVAGVAYLGWGTRGFIWRKPEIPDQNREFATMDMGYCDDYGVAEREKLIKQASQGPHSYKDLVMAQINKICEQFSRLDIEAQQVLIVIMMSHLLTPEIVEGFFGGVQQICAVLSVDNMRAGIASRQVRDVVMGFIATGGGGNGETPQEIKDFAEASRGFRERLVQRIQERDAQLAESEQAKAQLKDENTELNAQIARSQGQ